jgi:hypothetical protein
MFDKNFFFTPLFSTCFWIRDPGSGMGKNQDPGSGISIPDPQHCSFGFKNPCKKICETRKLEAIHEQHFVGAAEATT